MSVKKLVYILEYILILLVLYIFRLFSLKSASAIGGFLGRLLLRFFRLKVTRKNLTQAIKDLDLETEKTIISRFHENYGRNFIEYFFLDRLDSEKELTVSLAGQEVLEKCKNNGRPKIFITAHFGNWEFALWAIRNAGFPLVPIYRKINNPYIDKLILKFRSHITHHQINKGPKAGKECLKTLKKGQNLVLLVDQKMNEGLAVPFFGKEAMTPHGVIKLATIVNAEIIPGKITRNKGIDFNLTFYPPIEYDKNSPTVEYDTMLKINQLLESWITENPDQWFWFHRRWEKSFYETKN